MTIDPSPYRARPAIAQRLLSFAKRVGATVTLPSSSSQFAASARGITVYGPSYAHAVDALQRKLEPNGITSPTRLTIPPRAPHTPNRKRTR